jgi:hypothetical protein
MDCRIHSLYSRDEKVVGVQMLGKHLGAVRNHSSRVENSSEILNICSIYSAKFEPPMRAATSDYTITNCVMILGRFLTFV